MATRKRKTAATEIVLDVRPPAQGQVTKIEKVLSEREVRYGRFEDNASLSQALKRVMRGSRNWDKLSDPQRESLEMIQHKIARMLNGDPNYDDSVVDIIGYTDLMLRYMREKNGLQT